MILSLAILTQYRHVAEKTHSIYHTSIESCSKTTMSK